MDNELRKLFWLWLDRGVPNTKRGRFGFFSSIYLDDDGDGKGRGRNTLGQLIRSHEDTFRYAVAWWGVQKSLHSMLLSLILSVCPYGRVDEWTEWCLFFFVTVSVVEVCEVYPICWWFLWATHWNQFPFTGPHRWLCLTVTPDQVVGPTSTPRDKN